MNPEEISIIVIDDEDMVRINLTDFLEDEGFSVSGAASAEEGLRLLREKMFDVAIVDMRLPGMDGNAFILDAHSLQPHMQYLIHTGSADYSIPPDLRNLGISPDSVFYKPVHDMDLIRNCVVNLIKD